MKIKHIALAVASLYVGVSDMILRETVAGDQSTVFTPHKILPDGIDGAISINPYTGEQGPARKGTVAATINNVALLNKVLMAETPDEKHIRALADAMKDLIPSLRYIGVFDFFSIEEWVARGDQPGRVFVAVLYLQRYPKELTPALREKLETLQDQTKSPYLVREVETLLDTPSY